MEILAILILSNQKKTASYGRVNVIWFYKFLKIINKWLLEKNIILNLFYRINKPKLYERSCIDQRVQQMNKMRKNNQLY